MTGSETTSLVPSKDGRKYKETTLIMKIRKLVGNFSTF